MATYEIEKFELPNGDICNLKDNVSGYTTNTGTVTSVGLSNASGESDFTIASTPVTTSGTITIKHANTVTAQSTQALYPIKFDKHGHITGAGTAVTVPTKVSDLTNDSNFTSVSFSRNLTSGTKVGTITIDGTSTDLYAPTDTDTKVTNTLATTTKYYVAGTTTASTNTGTQVFDSGIYATTTAGQLNATTYKVNEQVTLQWNSTDLGLDFVFAQEVDNGFKSLDTSFRQR